MCLGVCWLNQFTFSETRWSGFIICILSLFFWQITVPIKWHCSACLQAPTLNFCFIYCRSSCFLSGWIFIAAFADEKCVAEVPVSFCSAWQDARFPLHLQPLLFVDEGEQAEQLWCTASVLLLKNPDSKCVYVHARKSDSCVSLITGGLSSSKIASTVTVRSAWLHLAYLLCIKLALLRKEKQLNTWPQSRNMSSLPHSYRRAEVVQSRDLRSVAGLA